MTTHEKSGIERREEPRLFIEDYFSLTITLPGSSEPTATRIKDISLSGLRFLLFDEATISQNIEVKARLYLNNKLYLPLGLKILRAGKTGYGCQIINTDAATVEALKHFIAFIQIAQSITEVDSST